jgi:hypothetical protein
VSRHRPLSQRPIARINITLFSEESQKITLEHERANIGMHIRITHYTDYDLLVIKMLSMEHEIAQRQLARRFDTKLGRMGIDINDFIAIGAGKLNGPNSAKEGDDGYKPSS